MLELLPLTLVVVRLLVRTVRTLPRHCLLLIQLINVLKCYIAAYVILVLKRRRLIRILHIFLIIKSLYCLLFGITIIVWTSELVLAVNWKKRDGLVVVVERCAIRFG